jgi:hypothetical protein
MLWYLYLTNNWGSVSLGDPMQKNPKSVSVEFSVRELEKKPLSLISFIIVDDLL